MPQHVVVDGSNIATEGRSLPSLSQLNDAVLAYMAEHPDALITVVVDATFGHRIDAKEVNEFDDAVSNNELVAPPAGAIGRGDAFVLSIANKVDAIILTNDSYQEFHGRPEYSWLFEEGRLVGGKPVPNIGWVFVNRVPVRGPVSRNAVKEAKRKSGGSGAEASSRRTRRPAASASPQASLPMPIPKSPPPRASMPKDREGTAAVAAAAVEAAVAAPSPSPRDPVRATSVNDLMAFLHFVEHHPVGSSVNAVVESYSSHGAYVTINEADGTDVKGYVPLRLMSDPAPRSAREFMKIADAVTLVVESFTPARRSIDLGMPTMVAAIPVSEPTPKKTVAKRVSKKSAAAAAAPDDVSPVDIAAETPAAKPRRGAKQAAPKKAASPRTAKASASVEPMSAVVGGATADAAAAEAPAPKGRRSRSGGRAVVPVESGIVAEPVVAESAKEPRGRATKKAAAPAAALPFDEVTPPAAAPAKAAGRARKKAAAPAAAASPTARAANKPAKAARAKPAPAKATPARATTAKATAAKATAKATAVKATPAKATAAAPAKRPRKAAPKA